MNAEKTDDQIAKEKAAVAAMKSAAANMQSAISRINTLEQSLKSVDWHLQQLRGTLGEGLYAHIYPIKGNEKSVISLRKFIDDLKASIAEVMP
ncbi:hypothetical protein [Phyllobacterium chamaecytisi]|uniref:hypothetical protein n=1 Tax=Phyllobacterium chamaecytisi TaxID=2876082 RepID=UPI001CCB6738|nr:hypothetical protein [Phyllobacterium sp. KW56]MBZ9600701.1 hypothetical protein [Phyllobacterium sp. KW56]